MVCIVAAGVLVGMGWAVDHYRTNALQYKGQRDTVTGERNTANATIDAMKTRQLDLAALDKKYTKELADAKAENDVLVRKLDYGGRMLVKGRCPVPASTETSGASSVDDDATIELSNTAGRNVLGIRSGIKEDQAKIAALQQFITEQCSR